MVSRDHEATSDGVVGLVVAQMKAIRRLYEGISDAMSTAGYICKDNVATIGQGLARWIMQRLNEA